MPSREILPVLLHGSGKLAVIVGGGKVGRRKVKALREANLRVRLVCLESRPSEEEDAGLEWVCEPYTPAHLNSASLVLAAGPAELNSRVVGDARARGLWVSSASDPEGSDFSLPASARRGGILLAVSTGGAAPALSANLCAWLAGHLDEAVLDWVGLLGEFRPLILARVRDPDERARLLTRLAGWEWLGHLRLEGKERVRERMEVMVRDAAALAEG